jgi:hypothetical protein
MVAWRKSRVRSQTKPASKSQLAEAICLCAGLYRFATFVPQQPSSSHLGWVPPRTNQPGIVLESGSSCLCAWQPLLVVLEELLGRTNRTVIAVGPATGLLHYLVISLIHDLKCARPKRSEFFDPGLGGVQIRGGLKPYGTLWAFFSDDVVVRRFHISEQGLLSMLRT